MKLPVVEITEEQYDYQLKNIESIGDLKDYYDVLTSRMNKLLRAMKEVSGEDWRKLNDMHYETKTARADVKKKIMNIAHKNIVRPKF